MCADEHFLAWNFFQKFWTVSDFLQKPLACFSNFYLRVQSKYSGRNNFSILLFRVFFGFWAKFFPDFWPENFKKFSKLPSKCPEEQFVSWNIFLKIWIVLDFLQKTLQWFSNIYLRVQSKKSGRNKLFILLLSFLLDFERNIFRLLAKKTSRSCQNYPLRVQTNNFWIEFFFKSFEPFWIFCRNLWHGSQTSIFVSRVKIPEEIIFLFFFSEFFSDFERKFLQNSGQKTSRSFQNYLLSVQRYSLWLEIFFLKIWIVLDFLQKSLQWFSNIYLRVQTKKSGRNKFFILLLSFFSDSERKKFRFLAKKLEEVVKTNFCVSRRTIFGLIFFFKCFEPFWIFCRNLWHGSQSSIYVSRVKLPEETIFLTFLFRIFPILSEIISDFGQKNFKKLSKLTSVCADEHFLAWNFFQKFWTVSDFLQKPLACFSIFYLRVQSKNSGRNNFCILLFRVFFGFWAKFFPDFCPENFKKFSKLPSKCPEEQFVSWNVFLKIWIVLDFLQKTLQWFSNIYLRVQSKKSGRNKLFILLLSFLLDFERKQFQIFGQKTSRSCQN